MELSAKSEYALRALIEIATVYHRSEPLRTREVAERQQIPDRYLEQLLAVLRRGGLVRSQRGVKGGYILASDPSEISVLDVIRCIEGLEDRSFEASRKGKTIESNLIGDVRSEVKQVAESVLSSYSLQTLLERRSEMIQEEIMYYI